MQCSNRPVRCGSQSAANRGAVHEAHLARPATRARVNAPENNSGFGHVVRAPRDGSVATPRAPREACRFQLCTCIASQEFNTRQQPGNSSPSLGLREVLDQHLITCSGESNRCPASVHRGTVSSGFRMVGRPVGGASWSGLHASRATERRGAHRGAWVCGTGDHVDRRTSASAGRPLVDVSRRADPRTLRRRSGRADAAELFVGTRRPPKRAVRPSTPPDGWAAGRLDGKRRSPASRSPPCARSPR